MTINTYFFFTFEKCIFCAREHVLLVTELNFRKLILSTKSESQFHSSNLIRACTINAYARKRSHKNKSLVSICGGLLMVDYGEHGRGLGIYICIYEPLYLLLTIDAFSIKLWLCTCSSVLLMRIITLVGDDIPPVASHIWWLRQS